MPRRLVSGLAIPGIMPQQVKLGQLVHSYILRQQLLEMGPLDQHNLHCRQVTVLTHLSIGLSALPCHYAATDVNVAQNGAAVKIFL